MAEWKFGSAHRQKGKKKQRAEQELRSAHARAVKNFARVLGRTQGRGHSFFLYGLT